MPDITALINSYGLTIALVLWFIYRDLWPLLRDKIVPGYIAEKQISKQQQHDEVVRREDKLIQLHEQNAEAFIKLSITLDNINTTLSRMNERLESIDHDVSNLYGLIGERRGLIKKE